MRGASIVGQKFGLLTVTKKIGEYHQCVCDCGMVCTKRTDHIKTGHTKSCGCYAKAYVESVKKPKAASAPKKRNPPNWSYLHGVWSNMVERCTNTKHPKWYRYGGRGIAVCEAWQTFSVFYEDMHKSYKRGLQIERIDNNLGYSKENCKWATPLAQGRNRCDNLRVRMPENKYVALTAFCEAFDVPYKTARQAYHAIEDAQGTGTTVTSQALLAKCWFRS